MNLKTIRFITISLVIITIALALCACGSDTQRQTRTAEKLTTVTGPIIVDTPIGQIAVQPVKHEMVRSQDEISTEQYRVSVPEVGQVIGAAAGGMSGLGVAGGLLGIITTAAAGWKAMQFRRQRDEMISGVEKAKAAMDGDTWERVKDKMAAAQSDDTQRVIYDKTP